VTIEVVCGDTTLSPTFVIPAGTAAGPVSQTYADIPGGVTCNVQEDGERVDVNRGRRVQVDHGWGSRPPG
jgi:hypothetical protein